MRPVQWLKNLLVFAGLVFAKELGDPGKVALALQAFVVFCLISSAVYLLNDILDRERDRLHPLKRMRPLASGALGPAACLAAALAAVAGAFCWGFFLGLEFMLVGAGYLVLNLLYSWRLKQVVIIDVMALSLGFVLRVLAGTLVIGVYTSPWLLLCTFLLSLFLGFGKRRHELVLLEEEAPEHRDVLVHYSPYFLDQMISIVTTSTLLCYILYTLSPETVRYVGGYSLLYSVPFVMYGIFRYLYLIHRHSGGGDPTQLVLTDRSLLISVACWFACALAVLY
ncbi:MAG: decaprenyl-phosphate phosphoribosyltransferase [Candidatus Glassbacteria bacterium]|nr:decaprenyl-phosphate phosphoribosyltransferase [Candidatus Glassbacteria bacterium]